MAQKILITGAQGFVGSRLVSVLNRTGFTAHGPGIDLFDYASLQNTIQAQPWDAIIHLAAISHVPTCEKDPTLAYRTNVCGTSLLLESVKAHCPKAHIVFPSTAQVYAPSEGLLNENSAIDPQNIYSRTKWQSELILKDWAERYGIKTTVFRLFTHTHKTQPPDFFIPHLYSQMLRAGSGSELTIPVGDLDLYRDFGTIQDLLKSFQALLALGKPKYNYEVFNISSGTQKHLKKIAETLARELKVKAEFTVEASRLRPGEPKVLLGSHEKFTALSHWKPTCKTEDDLVKQFLTD